MLCFFFKIGCKQWRLVFTHFNRRVKVIYALSPQAKGKIENLIDGFKIGWSGPVTERISGISKKLN